MDDPARLSRRTLLAAAAALPAAAAAGPPAAAGLRGQLLLDPAVRYFNAANIGPAFAQAVAVQEAELRAFQADPSRERRERYPVPADRLRARLGRRLGVTGEEIALVRNASEANTVAVLGLNLQPGDGVIVAEHNHQSTLDS